MSAYLLGNYVKEYRQTHGLSLRDFGNLCGISHTTIDCIEKGYDPRTKKTVNITNNTFLKLSEAMGIPLHVLVGLSVGDDELLRIPGGWASRAYLAAKVAESNNLPNLSPLEKNKPIPDSEDELRKLDENLIERLLSLYPDEIAKVDAFVQGLLAARGD